MFANGKQKFLLTANKTKKHNRLQDKIRRATKDNLHLQHYLRFFK